MLDFGPETPEVNPQPADPSTAQAVLDAFQAEHADALLDGNHVGHRAAVKARSELYRRIHGDGPAEGPMDVGSSGDVEPLEVGDVAGAIERSISRELGPGQFEGVGAFAAELAEAGLHPAEAAFLVPEVARSSPLTDDQLRARVSRQDMRDAASFLAANPALDELAADFTHYPAVLRWAADKWRTSK